MARASGGWLGNLGLMLGSVLICVVGAEFAGRLIANRASIFHFPNFITEYADLHGRGYALDYDPVVGWIPKRNHRGINRFDGTDTTISPEGTRMHATDSALAAQTPILAVGDSFTYGGDVGDEGTWPAALQKALGRRVINGGVGGYGLDQTILRAEQLVPIFKPDLILIAMIADDIARTGMRVRAGTAKPYFDMVEGKLVARNHPVPPPDSERRKLDPLRAVLGYSYLVDFAMRRLGKLDWWYGGISLETVAHENIDAVACALLGRAKDLAERANARAIVVIQHVPVIWTDAEFAKAERATIARFSQCARDLGLGVIDTEEAVGLAVKRHGIGPLFTASNHMSAAGNSVVGEAVAAALGRLNKPQ